jgi:D-amino-acid dehydrogenase
MRKVDALVLGAGIVGVSAAWHLAERGRNVVLLDRRGPGEETSYGNSGVIERDGLVPITFPKGLGSLLRYAGNRTPEMTYSPGFLPTIAPWLMELRRLSNESGNAAYAAAMDPLLKLAVPEHKRLAAAAGAERYFRDTGWLKISRTERGYGETAWLRRQCDRYGVAYQVLSPQEVAAVEPALKPRFARALLFPETATVSSPGGVTVAYAEAFRAGGGAVLKGDARTLVKVDELWQVDTDDGVMAAPVAVVALGPWSMDLLSPLGYRFPFAVKRGYHRHFAPVGSAMLARPVVDTENGFVITPMEKGIRITTGIEFADRDAPPNPIQLRRVLPLARELFPIGEPVEPEAWMGRRPSFPDALPIIGPAPRHPGLWMDFGHGHLGFTLGPVSGRLIAAMIAGEEPAAEVRPFAATRFR